MAEGRGYGCFRFFFLVEPVDMVSSDQHQLTWLAEAGCLHLSPPLTGGVITCCSHGGYPHHHSILHVVIVGRSLSKW